jgi:PAS domain S-box/PAS domain S-box
MSLGAIAPLRILLVEDTSADARLIETILRVPAFEVMTVGRLSDALAVLRSTHIDVVLLDLMLPDSRGAETLQTVLEQALGIAIVIITGNDDEQTALDAVADGAQDYLIKGRTNAEAIVRSVRYAFERNRAEEQQLRTSEKRFRALVENSADGISLLDRDGNILYSSPAITRILGYSLDEFVGRNLFTLIHPDDVGEARQRFGGILADHPQPARMIDLRYRHRDSSWRYIEVLRSNRLDDPAVRAIVVNYRDVTERRQALDTAEGLRRRYELILNSIADGVNGLDCDGNITFVNPAAAAMLGWEAKELIGKPAHETLHVRPGAVSHDMGRCPIQATLAYGVACHISDDTFWRKDGTSFRIDYVAAPWRDSEGRTDGVVVVFRDITKPQEMQRQVDQALRVSSLGRVAASVAHEFNNVLMGIQPFAEILQRKIGNDLVLQKPLKHILDGVRRGRLVSHQILRFASPAEPQMALVDVGEWTREFSEEARLALRDRRLDVGPSESLMIRADPAQLCQVMLNLVTNARDVSAVGSTVTIGSLAAGADPFLREQLSEPWRFAAFFVRDRGPGIPREVLDHIFEPLFTTKKTGGTGLGLAVAQQIVSAHDGKILVDSQAATGSTFYVVLPIEQTTFQSPEMGGESVATFA